MWRYLESTVLSFETSDKTQDRKSPILTPWSTHLMLLEGLPLRGLAIPRGIAPNVCQLQGLPGDFRVSKSHSTQAIITKALIASHLLPIGYQELC